MEMSTPNPISRKDAEYPVVIKVTEQAAVSVVCNKTTNDIETRLAAVSLDAFSMMEAVTDNISMLCEEFEQLKAKDLRLLQENAALSEQLIASHSREREISRLHSLQEDNLRAQMASMQAQMANQNIERQAEVQRLQTLLTTAQHEKTGAVAAAQAVWEQQKTQLIQQNGSFQNQIKALQGQVTSLTNTINGEKQRQETAITAKLATVSTALHAKIDSEIKWCENQNTLTPQWNGKPYNAKAALEYLKSCLPGYLR